jgi:hypothetical protein
LIRRYYRARLVGAGPFVPVMVWHGAPFIDGTELDRSPRWQALVGVEPSARAVLMGDEIPIEVDGVTLRNLERISEQTYRFMVADAQHAANWRPDDPKASPQKAVDFNKLLPF